MYFTSKTFCKTEHYVSKFKTETGLLILECYSVHQLGAEQTDVVKMLFSGGYYMLQRRQ